MARKRCYGCMQIKENSPICEHCGFNENIQNESHQLPQGTVLRGQYLVGKALGQGGFGITYLGWDLHLEIPIAIKEYYPNSIVNRDATHNPALTGVASNMMDMYISTRQRFLREAKVLAMLRNIPNIVQVHNFFEENNTAYIVMEYVKGIDLRRYMNMRGGRLSVEETLTILKPVMAALARVHDHEIVHRDISPDNIMMMADGTAKLLDFGAVRNIESANADQDLQHSTESILKHGFAPMEQYQKRGALGPWTDEYAMCATVYYCLTGRVPPDAPQRMMEDVHPAWEKIPGLSAHQRAVLEKGMSLRGRDRFPSIKEFMAALYISKAKPAEQVPPWKHNILMKQLDKGTPSDILSCKYREVSAFRTHIPRTRIRSVYFLSTLKNAPADAFDVSYNMDRSVLAWILDKNAYMHDLFIAANGGINGRYCEDLFFGFENLQNIYFCDAFHTEECNSMRSMFEHCAVQTLDLSSFDTSSATDFSRLFADCRNLTEVNLSSFNTAKVTDLHMMFSNCTELRSLDLRNFDTSNVLDMSCMFEWCHSLSVLNLSGWDTANVTDTSQMFDRCNTLPDIDIAHWDTSKITEMFYMFAGCHNLTKLDLSRWNTSNVTNMSGMFLNCKKMMYLHISTWDTANVTEMDSMFLFCDNLIGLDPSGWDVSNVDTHEDFMSPGKTINGKPWEEFFQ